VLCNLFGTGAHDSAHLGQPFSNDFELTVDGLGTSAVHVSGFSKGDLGPVETETAEKRPAQTGKPVEIAAVGPVTSGSKGTGAASSSIAGRAKAVDSAAMMGIEDEGEEDDDEDDDEGEEDENGEEDEEGEESEEDNEDGEGEGEDDEDDEEGEDEDEDEEADMPLAPPSVAEILKGGKRPASSSKAPPSKPAKTAKAEAPATAAKPAAQLAAAKPSTPAAKPPAPKPVKLEGGLEYVDLQAGGGPLATRGRKVNVKYRGTLTNGKQFDEGTINFRLGGGEVIRGWDLGVAGMKVGGKRSLRIPPHLAYGKKGVPPTIPPNATLLFDVQLLKC